MDVLAREAIYRAVRAGGQSAWDENRKAKAQGRIRHVPERFLDFGPNDTWEEIEKRIRSAG